MPFCTSSVSHSCHWTPWVTWRDSFHSKYGQKIRILVFMGHSVKICTTLQNKLMTLERILFRTVSIPFISPFYILLFINIVHIISTPVNCTYCREQINQSTETDVSSLAPRKNPLTWFQKWDLNPHWYKKDRLSTVMYHRQLMTSCLRLYYLNQAWVNSCTRDHCKHNDAVTFTQAKPNRKHSHSIGTYLAWTLTPLWVK